MSDWRRVKKLVTENWQGTRLRYAVVVLILVLGSALAVLDPILYGKMVDVIVDALRDQHPETIVSGVAVLLALWIGVFVINVTLNIVGRYIFWKANNILGLNFACSAVRDMLSWSRQRFSRLSTGRTVKVFDQAWEALFWVPGDIVEQVIPTVLTFTAVVIAGLILDWRLTIASLIMLPIAIWLGYYGWKKARPKQEQLDHRWAALSRHVGESIGNISVVQDYAQEDRRARTFASLMRQVVVRQLRMNVFWALFHGTGSTLTLLGRAAVFIVGVYLVANGSTTLGTLITFLGMLNYLLSPIQHVIGNSLPRMSMGVSHLRLYTDLADEINDLKERDDAVPLKKIVGDVELKGVHFTYGDQSRATLLGIDLTIPAGTSCALVGPSGAGKSTLVKLINRTIDPTRGCVHVDGKDHCLYTLTSLRRHIGVVTQDTYLFHDTILNNVKFVKPNATEREVVHACKMAQAHDYIRRLPNGYRSIVGERGVKLSGGERQRIALARIFLADPPILVLDESTSALDSETEHRIQQTLKEVMKGRTSILIAHRLSTVYLADQIAVMERGKIVDIGTHDELIKKGGLYDRLWSLQSDGYIS